MTNDRKSPLPADQYDDKLAEILAELIEGRREGGKPELEALARKYPELAAELRSLWPALMVSEEVARAAAAVDVDAADPRAHTVSAGGSGSQHAEETRASAAPLPRWFGGYELLEEVGRGGMGVVYRARQRSPERTVALKLIRRGDVASAADLARFRAEAESAARLDHPNIVPVYEVGEQDGQPYFTMKLVEGTTLARRLADGPLTGQEAARLLAPVCRAIQVAHEGGILHRDLKPSNVLIDRDGIPHVTDFGLAKRVETAESLTQSGAVLGTPSYMAPEQAAGDRGRITAATDVYSLGGILYETLTGRPPFLAATPVETVLQVLEQEPLPPRLLNPQADPELEMVALKCLQKPPELRYASAAALARDFEAYLANEPVTARSGRFRHVLSRLFRETHHARVLESWGLLWIWHSVFLLVLCLLTNGLQGAGVEAAEPYLGLWVIGLGSWAAIFWALRRRSGPVTFVERQIAHVWGGALIACGLLFAVEMLLGLDTLELAPALALIGGMTFLVKAGILSGVFYFQAGAHFLTALLMASFPNVGLSLLGIVGALSFFIPGWKYYRQRRQST